MFETEICFINSLKKKDYADVKKLFVNQDVRKFLGGIRDEESIRVVLDDMLNPLGNSFYWVVREKQSDNFIGLVSLDPHHEGSYLQISYQLLHRVRYVCQQLKNMGYIHTYDWTVNDRATTIYDLREIGTREKRAVLESDFIIVILPAGKGSHIELGIALGENKNIYLYSPNDDVNNFETTSTFYHLNEVEKCFGTIDELVVKVTQ